MVKTNHGTIVLRDGLAVANPANPLEWFHNNTPQSMEWALANEGYSIIEDDPDSISTHAVVNGWLSYLTIKGRTGYGMTGFIVRTLEELTYLAEQDGATLTNDRIVSEFIIPPMLSAVRHALDYAGGNLLNIRGELDAALEIIAAKFGIDYEGIA